LQRAALVSLGKGPERNAVRGQSSAYLTSPTLSDPYMAAIVVGLLSGSNRSAKVEPEPGGSILFAWRIFYSQYSITGAVVKPSLRQPTAAKGIRSLRDEATMKCAKDPGDVAHRVDAANFNPPAILLRSRVLNRRFQLNGGGDYSANSLIFPVTGADPSRAEASAQIAVSGPMCGPTSIFKKDPRPSACPAERLACRGMREGVPAIPAVSPSPNSYIP
jgi:hypothetical protein